MTTRQFLFNLAIIGTAMALISLFEIAVPLYARGNDARGRAPANLGLALVTFLLNWGMTTSAAMIALVFSMRNGFLASLGLSMAAQIAVTIVVLDFFFGYVARRTMHH